MGKTEVYRKTYGNLTYSYAEAIEKANALNDGHGVYNNPLSQWKPAKVVPEGNGYVVVLERKEINH